MAKEWRIKRGVSPHKADERIWCCVQYMNADSYPSKDTMAAILGLEHVKVPDDADWGETREPMDLGGDVNCIQE